MITHKYIDIQNLTPGVERYFPLFRLMVCFGLVDILRNKFDINSGLYLVGIEEEIKVTEVGIREIIKKVEKRAANFKGKKNNIHLSQQRASYKDKLIKTICSIMQEELRALKNSLSPTIIFERSRDGQLRKNYIEQTPSLKILKTFRCQTN